jgi:hypothetical protein
LAQCGSLSEMPPRTPRATRKPPPITNATQMNKTMGTKIASD